MSIHQQKTAVILAAGMGKRLGELTEKIPKALLNIAEKPLIDYMIAFVEAVGFDRIFVVGGYQYQMMEAHIKNLQNKKITIVENREYEQQRLLSFRAGLSAVETSFLQCDVDYIFTKRVASIVKSNLKGFSIFCVRREEVTDPDVMKVKIDEEGNVEHMSKQLVDYEYVYTGMFFCSETFLPLMRQAVEESLKQDGPGRATVETALNIVAGTHHCIDIVDIGGHDWVEIDTPEDLARAERFVREHNADLVI